MKAIFLTLIAIAAINRNPGLVLHPQIWGDEASWFKDAYLVGPIRALFIPQAGYLCVISRVPALLAIHVPMRDVPLVFGASALLVQIGCASLLLTSRFESLGSLSVRFLLALLWIAVPDSGEIPTLNDSPWILGVFGALLLFAAAKSSTLWRVFDVVAVALIAITGPYSIILVPLSWLRRI